MQVRRKIVREEGFLAALAESGMTTGDPRVEAAEWYIQHGARHHDARVVAETSDHGPLWCYRTREIGRMVPITVYFYFRDGGQTACIVGMMSQAASPG